MIGGLITSLVEGKDEGSTRPSYTGFRGTMEDLKIETRLIGESFECVMGECVRCVIKNL